jgi:hypothetical protein
MNERTKDEEDDAIFGPPPLAVTVFQTCALALDLGSSGSDITSRRSSVIWVVGGRSKLSRKALVVIRGCSTSSGSSGCRYGGDKESECSCVTEHD